MLKKITEGILKYKGIILFVMALLFAVSVVGTVFLVISDDKINSDVASYLDEDSATKTGIVFLQENFDIRGYATLVVRVDESKGEETLLREKTEKLMANEQITDITWAGKLDSVGDVEKTLSDTLQLLSDNKELLTEAVEAYGDAEGWLPLLELTKYADVDGLIDAGQLKDYLRYETSTPGVYDYVLLFLLATDGVGEESYALLETIKEEFSYTEYVSSGSIETGYRLLNDTLRDLPWFILVGVVVVLIILFLTTQSYVEPLIMLLTLAVGIVISMGMNYLFPSISIISFAIGAVLQLAITMDYAVFYTHLYHKNRSMLDAKAATLDTWSEAAASILASGLTTVGGFVALYFMHFRIGADIANVLIKGIVLSVVTVLLMQPIMMYLFDKQIASTTHRFTEKFNEKKKPKTPLKKGMIAAPIARFSVFARIGLIVVAVGLIVPCFLAQSNVPYSYLELYEKKNKTEEQVLSNRLGNQLIFAVPTEIVLTDKTHADFVEELYGIDGERINGVMSVFNTLNVEEQDITYLLAFKNNPNNLSTVSNFVDFLWLEEEAENPEGGYEEKREKLKEVLMKLDATSTQLDLSVVDSYFRQVDGEWYTLYTVSIGGDAEDEGAQKICGEILSLCDKYFGKDKAQAIGMMISVYEMAQITPGDFLRVTIVSAAIIFLIVLLLLRNPLKSFLIVAVIELGIWINLSFSYLAGASVNFIVYIIISSVELGCTVDYAILFANTFERNRKSAANGKECAVRSATESLPAIFTGALLIAAVCFGMYLISSNIVIRQLVGVLARGAVVSFALVALVLPAVWSFFPVKRRVVDYASKIENVEEKISGKKPKKSLEEKLKELEEKEKNNK